MRAVLLSVAVMVVAGPVASPAAAAKSQRQGSVNYLELAAVLVRDGNYERAEAALRRVDTSDEELDSARYHLVRGLVRLHRGLHTQAAQDFRDSISLYQERKAEDEDAEGPKPILYVYLAQALYYSDQYEAALEAMDRAGAKAEEIKSTYALRAESLWKLGRHEASWHVLDAGLERYPDYHELLRRKLYYAIDLKLYKIAAELGQSYLARANAGYEDYLALGRALTRAGSTERGLQFLELARLRAPDVPSPAIELARVYRERQQYRTAAALMERIALLGTSEAFLEAAELYRLAGEHWHALALNRYIVDSEARLRQRLAIALDMRAYTTVTIMENDLRRTRLLDDENVRYALAYAYFKNGSFAETKRLLSGLETPELFRKATALREAMNRCADTPWSC